MILWILALVMLGLVGMVGYYQGAVRAACSFIGLIIAAALAMPLGGLITPILKLFGLKHPVWLMFIGPIVAFVIILTIFKIVGHVVHRKLDTYYKYQNSDTLRLLFERLNHRLGVCLGVLNAVVYMFLISVILYTLGYFTVQAATSEKDPFTMKLVNKFNEDLKATSFDKAIAPFGFAKENYYDAVDVLGDVFHNSILQNRLATYPPFLPLTERPEFKDFGNDVKFQGFWAQGPAFTEFKRHERIRPLLESVDLYTNVVATLNGDFKDLKTYLETGKLEKYGEEPIIGRWDIDKSASVAAARKAKPNITSVELRALGRAMDAMKNARLVAFLDNKARLQIPTTNKVQNLQGTWKSTGGTGYAFSFSDGKRTLELPAKIEGSKLALSKDNVTLVFEK